MVFSLSFHVLPGLNWNLCHFDRLAKHLSLTNTSILQCVSISYFPQYNICTMQKSTLHIQELHSQLGTTSKFWGNSLSVKIDGGGGKDVYLYWRISHFPLKKGNSAVKIDGGRGSRTLSLQCKDREFPRNFDVIP